eukprot:CAMPEP_0202844992 /NCGR_PEP_ID=MMETSP1389-20130828/68833_1 /ASSEMBLY_ACC=CAM_ASM_000865 /TAXON_ID=302021 /ORGANISM="Rhodomonas sp., Strain CCMP768" /LENGTH=120 /DNA_ID=CAMNT_0049522381 /DNA_START=172 /DNA_END=531 /DNA_ORIENTATION=-
MRSFGPSFLLLLAWTTSFVPASALSATAHHVGHRQWGLRTTDVERMGVNAPLRLRGGIAYMAAYMLCKMGGNEHPTVADVTALLQSVDAEANQEQITKVVTELNGKNIQDMVDQGREMVE